MGTGNQERLQAIFMGFVLIFYMLGVLPISLKHEIKSWQIMDQVSL